MVSTLAERERERQVINNRGIYLNHTYIYDGGNGGREKEKVKERDEERRQLTLKLDL